MGYVRTKGVVIKEIQTGEDDKIVNVLSNTYGKITCFAKGAKRPKSRLAAATQFLCYSDLMLYKGKDMYIINSAEIIEPFIPLRTDLTKITYASHLADITSDVTFENQSANKTLKLFLNCIYNISRNDKSFDLIIAIFEIRLLSTLGYSPSVMECTKCGITSDIEQYYFSFQKCGVLCNNCKEADLSSIKIYSGTLKAIRHILYSKIEDLFNFQVSQTVLGQLKLISKRYLEDRLERKYTKLEFLKII